MDPAIEERLGRLLQRAQEGDRGAYAEFLHQARELVRSQLRDRVRSPQLLDDVLQETLLSIHRSRHTYDSARPVGPWIRAIALNRLRDSGRAYRRQQDRASADREWEQSLHAAGTADTATSTFLRAALETLSEAQREVICMLKFEGYSITEIAGRTGRSPAAIKVTAHRGYRALRTLLGSR